MEVVRSLILMSLFMLYVCSVEAQVTVYVAPDGNDANSGDVNTPFKTVTKGLAAVGTNGTVFVRAGTYLLGSAVKMSGSGTADKPIKLWAYTGEKPVLDCKNISSDGLSISGSYYHLRGLDICNAGHNGINISGNNNTIENCTLHDNKNTGLHLTGSGTGPSGNLILNCDSYCNYDAPVGGNADGFSAKWTVGPKNVFRGCRAYNNSDDGWDLWMGTGSIVIENCWAFRNGVDLWHSGSFAGNGNGFKLGGNNVATPHTVRNCIAFDNTCNGGKGFDENNNLAGQTIYNCTSFRNKNGNYVFTNTLTTGQSHLFKNCISLNGKVSITSGTRENNSWQGFTVSEADFISVDTNGVTAPRNSDGTLQQTSFFRLVKGSSLVNAGVDVGLPFAGTAPDLGAFETDLVGVKGNDCRQRPAFMTIRNNPDRSQPAMVIGYQLPHAGMVTLKIYDASGREVAKLVAERKTAGWHRCSWNTDRLTGGVYVARLQDGSGSTTRTVYSVK